MSHHCHAIGCTKSVPPKLLMCAPHWRAVPGALQRMIWKTYRTGQEVTKDPSPAYLLAQSHVVATVALHAGVFSSDDAREHVMQTLESLARSERLSFDDLDMLAHYDPLFGRLADVFRSEHKAAP